MSADHANVASNRDPNTPRRRLGRPATGAGELGIAMSRLLVEQPDLDEVARLVVALLAAPLRATGARVTIGSDAVGTCAVNVRDRVELARATDSLRGGARQTLVDPDCWVAAMSLGSDVAPLGAVATCMSSVTPTARALTFLREIALPLAVYAAGLLLQHSQTDRAQEEVDVPTVGSGSLSARQLQVLSGLRDGLTRGQIASRLGFSDSTIRAESLAIYRHFGVHSRNDAVRRAYDAGLLPSLTET